MLFLAGKRKSLPLPRVREGGLKRLAFGRKAIEERKDKRGHRRCYDTSTGKQVKCPEREGKKPDKPGKPGVPQPPTKPRFRYDPQSGLSREAANFRHELESKPSNYTDGQRLRQAWNRMVKITDADDLRRLATSLGVDVSDIPRGHPREVFALKRRFVPRFREVMRHVPYRRERTDPGLTAQVQVQSLFNSHNDPNFTTDELLDRLDAVMGKIRVYELDRLVRDLGLWPGYHRNRVTLMRALRSNIIARRNRWYETWSRAYQPGRTPEEMALKLPEEVREGVRNELDGMIDLEGLDVWSVDWRNAPQYLRTEVLDSVRELTGKNKEQPIPLNGPDGTPTVAGALVLLYTMIQWQSIQGLKDREQKQRESGKNLPISKLKRLSPFLTRFRIVGG